MYSHQSLALGKRNSALAVAVPLAVVGVEVEAADAESVLVATGAASESGRAARAAIAI